MLGIEELLTELGGDEAYDRGLPPGFRFHPTDEELITFYLATKVFHGGYTLCGVPIAELDLNRCEPWELPELGKMGEREWFFFSLRDRKYPTGLRTNRATSAGYWKATGKDREVHSVATGALVGMKKTLVFYRGRAPRGEKTKWVMHEYRLEGDLSDSCRRTCKEEWVICRIYDKRADNKMGISISQSHQPEVCSASATATAATVANSFPQQPATLPLECQARNPVPALQFRDPFPNNYDLKSLLINQPVPETSLPFLMHLPKTFLQDQHGDDPIFKEQAVVPGSSAIPTHSKAEVYFPDVYYCHDQNLFFPCEMDGSLLDLAVAAAAAHNTSNAASKYHMSRSSHAFNTNMMLDPSRHH